MRAHHEVMTKDATPEQPTTEQPTPEGLDATEVFSTQDSTQALPAAEQTDSASPEHAWTAADQAEHELRAPADAAATGASPAAEPAYAASAGSAYAAPAGASQPPVPPRSGFWGRVGQAWRRVWASALGKVAVIAAAALAVFAVIAAIALGAFFGGRGERMADRWEAACLQGQGQGSMGNPGRRAAADRHHRVRHEHLLTPRG